jgi:hypothetical protein
MPEENEPARPEADKADKADKADSSTRFSVWLGIIASAVSVLAFFGVTNWNQVKHVVFPQPSPSPSVPVSVSATPPNEAACTLAWRAQDTENQQLRIANNNNDPAAGMVVMQAYADALDNAATTTSDPVLSSYLTEDANALQQNVQAEQDRNFAAAAQWLGEVTTYQGNWSSYCISNP